MLPEYNNSTVSFVGKELSAIWISPREVGSPTLPDALAKALVVASTPGEHRGLTFSALAELGADFVAETILH